jgi:hypothetical protein
LERDKCSYHERRGAQDSSIYQWRDDILPASVHQRTMIKLVPLLIMLSCLPALCQNITNLYGGQLVWSGMPVTTVYSVPSSYSTNSFTNATAITGSGDHSSYSSTITSTGLSGTISHITVAVSNWTQVCVVDAGLLLVGPDGQKVALCVGSGGCSAGTSYVYKSIMFDDSASAGVTFGGSNPGTNVFTCKPSWDEGWGPRLHAPAPDIPYSTTLSSMDPDTPNGVWTLYVDFYLFDNDCCYGHHDAGSVGGWGITIVTQ